MNKIVLLAITMLCFGGACCAEDFPKADASVGYSYFRLGGSNGINQNGVSGSLAYNPNRWLGLVADIGGYHGSPSGVSVNTFTFLFGPRLSYRSGGRVTPFAQFLLGGSHLSASAFGASGSTNPFAWSFGGGADLPLTSSDAIALRPQLDYVGLHSNGSTSNCLRLSVALDFRFGKK